MKTNWVFLGVLLLAYPVLGRTFVSLKSDEVNMRTGPGERFPIKFVYHKRTYPLEVLDTYDHWHQVQEADGTTGWVRETMVSSARYVRIQEETPLLAKPLADAPQKGTVKAGVIGRIRKCAALSNYCLIQFKEIKGWLSKKSLWGIDPEEEID